MERDFFFCLPCLSLRARSELGSSNLRSITNLSSSVIISNGTHHSLPPAFCLLIDAIIPNLVDVRGRSQDKARARARAGRKPQYNEACNACMRPPAKSAFVRNENEDPAGEAARIDGRRIEGDQSSGLPSTNRLGLLCTLQH